MRIRSFYLFCLAFVGHGWRVTSSKDHKQRSARAENHTPLQGASDLEQNSETHDELKQRSEQWTLTVTSHSMRRLAEFLLAVRPAAAFHAQSCSIHQATIPSVGVPRAQCARMSIIGSVVLRDFTGPAITFFSNLRTPAAVIAATAIKEAFKLWGDQRAGEEVRTSPPWTLLRYAYMLLMLLSVGCEVVTMFVATRAAAVLSTSNLHTSAPSLIEFLIRELEFEFVTVRFHFATGLFAFVLALGLRIRYTLRRYTDLSIAVALTWVYAVLAMVAYANQNPILYGGYAGLTARYFRLHYSFFVEQCTSQEPTKILANVAMVTAAILYFRAAFHAAKNLENFAEHVPLNPLNNTFHLPLAETFPKNKTFH